jgi:hypothetical protein
VHAKAALIYYAAFFALDVLAAALAYVLEGDNLLNLSLILFQRILYPRLMLYVVCKSCYSRQGVGLSDGANTFGTRP